MDCIYKILGISALFFDSTSKFQRLFIPYSVYFQLILVICLMLAARWLFTTLRDAGPPREVTIQEAVNLPWYTSHYIRLPAGMVLESDPKGMPLLMYRMSGAPSFLLIWPDNQSALIVKGSPTSAAHEHYSAIGMMRSITSDAHLDFRPIAHNKLLKVSINTQIYLDADIRPDSPIWPAIVLLLVLFLAGVMLVSVVQRYVVFCPTVPNAIPHLPIAPSERLSTFATGNFSFSYLDGSPTGVVIRWQSLATIIEPRAHGRIAITTLHAMTINYRDLMPRRRTGVLTITIRPASLCKIETGYHYYGTQASPALRIAFIDDNTGKPATAILAFNTPAEQVAATRMLTIG